jgi:hypothetical protein
MEDTFSLIDQQAWETFCTMHPHEAYDMDKDKYCAFVRSNNPKLTDEEITELIEVTR